MISLKNFKFKFQTHGFTLIEIVITTAMFTILATMVIANLRAGERSRNVRVAGDTVLSVLRQVQYSSLAGEPFGLSPIVPARDFGWQTAGTWGQFQTFKEQANAASPYNKTVVETINLPSQVVIDSASLRIGNDAVASLEIRFFPPFGEIRISGGTYVEAKNVIATFNIIYPNSTLTRAVVVDGISGRISVQ
jgi:prepilin-type N-terminal cleavage/methylation domain-containing protein